MGTVRHGRGVGALKGLLVGIRGGVAELETRRAARPVVVGPAAGVELAAVHVAVAGIPGSAASDLHVVVVVVVALGVICANWVWVWSENVQGQHEVGGEPHPRCTKSPTSCRSRSRRPLGCLSLRYTRRAESQRSACS